MRILAFESTAKPASVALCEDDRLIAQSFQNCGQTHSVTLLPMAQALLTNSGYTLQDIDLFAVAHGPGSFTGVRIGVSTVKGLAWGNEKPAVGVSALEAMAWNGTAFGEGALICCVMDARREQVYSALFEIRQGAPVRLCPDRAVALADLSEELRAGGKTAYLVGDGTEVTAAYFEKAGVDCVAAPEMLRWQSAYGVALAASRTEPGTADSVLPVYLRLSQAERERQARMEKQKQSEN